MSEVMIRKIALVTGGGSGIGEATAKALAAAGASVAVADMNTAGADRVVAEILALGGIAKSYKLDVSDDAAVGSVLSAIEKDFGGLHIAVNNAGIGGDQAPTGEQTPAGWRKVMAVNLDGVFYGMRYAIPAMLDAGGGAIVNIASILGSVGFANASAYTAAKHALLGLTRAAALEYSAKGIRVNAIGPAFIDTPLLAGFDEAARNWLIAMHPQGRLGRAEEVAALTTFLLSDQASFITGSYHLVDGGYCAV